MSGALAGIRVVEFGGIGPAAYGAMMLADHGAEVIRLERPDPGFDAVDADRDSLMRSRSRIEVDLKSEQGRADVLKLIERADALIDPFRPGVLERLGFGPDEALDLNPALVYARMTGWGQDGPLRDAVGHDINYLAISGYLSMIGPTGAPPPPPLNLVGDFGGGGMMMVFGMLAALVERQRSGRGQVVDASMLDGVASLFASIITMVDLGRWDVDRRQGNMLDGGSHWYGAYETKDGRFVAIGPLEGKFYANLLRLLDLDPEDWPQNEKARWPELRGRLADLFRTRTRDEWTELLGDEETCFSPVLGLDEARRHPHVVARGVYPEDGGKLEPAPTPRLSRTPAAIRRERFGRVEIDSVIEKWES